MTEKHSNTTIIIGNHCGGATKLRRTWFPNPLPDSDDDDGDEGGSPLRHLHTPPNIIQMPKNKSTKQSSPKMKNGGINGEDRNEKKWRQGNNTNPKL
jgi:hypothetical protein